VSLGDFPIEQVVVEVTGPGIGTPLVFNLTLTNGSATGTIEVPAGSDRLVTVTAFDAAGIATHRGSATISVEEGDNPSVTITLDALQGDQPIEAHIGTLTVTVEPSYATLEVGDTIRLKATVVAAGDDTLDVQVRWATLNPAKAWVDVQGLVTAVGVGEVGIVATYAGVGAQAVITIEPIPVPALDFNAAASHFTETPDDALLDLSTTWTIETWVNPTDATTGSFQHVVSKWAGGGNASYTLEISGEGKLRSGIHDGVNPTQAVESNATLADGVWQHVAVTLEAGTLRLYIDGVLDTTFPASQAPMNSTRPLRFGLEDSSLWKYDGLLAEVRIWSVARTEAQIAQAMDTRLTGSETGLLGYWKFDEGSGDVLTDAGGNGLDARLGSAVRADANDPTCVASGGPPIS